jgi:hypothetical protein
MVNSSIVELCRFVGKMYVSYKLNCMAKFEQPVEKCRDGRQLTFDDSRVGVSVRAAAKIMPKTEGEKPISAGCRGTITETERNEAGKVFRIDIDWGEEKIGWYHEGLRNIVFDEH